MNPKLVMRGAAIVLGLAGISCLFMPQEIFKLYHPTSEDGLLIQLLGASFLGFASLNWISRNALLGGIYGRPVVGANHMHFIIGSLLLVRTAISQPTNLVVWCTLVVYALFAIAFATILYGPPPKKDSVPAT